MEIEGLLNKKQKQGHLVSSKQTPEAEKMKKQSAMCTSRQRGRIRLPGKIMKGAAVVSKPLSARLLGKFMDGPLASNPKIAMTDADAIHSSCSNKVTSLTHAGGCISEQEFKLICKNWRIIKLQKQREEARKKIEAMTCTAGFQENLESMLEFEKLLGIKSQWMTTFGSE